MTANVGPEKTICKWRWSYPVIHVNRGEVRTCDKPVNIRITEEDFEKYGTDAFINNPYLTERRREKLVGLRHPDCFTCIMLEDRGIQSTRTGKERFVTYMNEVAGIPGTFEDFIRDPSNIDPRLLRADLPDILEISLSNLCNLKCAYCSPHFSTSWESELVKHREMRADEVESRSSGAAPSFEKYFWLWFDKIKDSLDRIIFIGGEPTINDKFLPYLSKMESMLKDSKSRASGKMITINIISNFNTPRKRFDAFLELLPSLAERFIVHIEASGEAFGERAEYIREGLDWDVYASNIRKLLALRHPNIRFGFQMAINALCVTSLKQLLTFAADLQDEFQRPVDYKENIVVSPEYLAPWVLTPNFAQHIEECYRFVEERLADPARNKHLFLHNEPSATRWRRYLPFLKSIHHGITTAQLNLDLRLQLIDFLRKNDHRRGRSFLATFPEYEGFVRSSVLARF